MLVEIKPKTVECKASVFPAVLSLSSVNSELTFNSFHSGHFGLLDFSQNTHQTVSL